MDSRRLAAGFGWGVIATIAMSAVMLAGQITGVAPMPKPIPVAIAGQVLGDRMPQPLLMLLGALGHLAYGGFWGAVLAALTRPVTVWKGIGLGILLWLGMGLAVLPFLGWGLFGTSVTPIIAGATLLLHLVYGATLGWGMDRRASSTKARGSRPSALGTRSR